MAVLLSSPYQQFFDNNGDPLSGGKIYTYSAGTTTPKATYTNSDGNVPLSNPVILDSAGRAVIWIDGAYKIVVADSLDNIIKTVDDVTGGGLLADGDYGDITVTGNGTVITIDNDVVTNAKLANASANSVKLNPLSSSDNPTDFGVNTNSVVGRLSGNITNIALGSAANNIPILDASAKYPAADGSLITNIGSVATTTATTSGTSVTFTVDFTTYFSYRIFFYNVSNATAAGSYTIEFSDDAAVSYEVTTYETKRILGTTVSAITASIASTANASDTVIGVIDVFQASTTGSVNFNSSLTTTGAGATQAGSGSGATTAACNRIRITCSQAFDAGSISVAPGARR